MPIYTLHSPLTAVEVEARLDLVPLKVTGNTIISAGTNTKVSYDSKGLVTGGSSATTADITSSLDKRYVTDADVTKIAAITASFTSAQETKLAGIASGATVGAAWATNLSGIPAVVSGTTASYTTEEAAKLAGIASGATVGAAWATNLSGIPAVVSGATASYTTEEAAKLAGIPVGGGGKVLQVVNATSGGVDTVSTSLTFSDTGLTATITPTKASSKIIVLVTQAGCGKSGTMNTSMRLELVRNATTLSRFEGKGGFTGAGETADISAIGACATAYPDFPNTTAPTTYKTRQASSIAGQAVVVDWGGSVSTITLLEIAVP